MLPNNPKQMLPNKFQLARAGLYYTGKSDICQCFQWHVKLSSWERDDDPTKEHFKWSRNCKYIKMIEAPPQCHSGFTFGSSATSFGGFEMGSSNMMKPLDPNCLSDLERGQERCHGNRNRVEIKAYRWWRVVTEEGSGGCG